MCDRFSPRSSSPCVKINKFTRGCLTMTVNILYECTEEHRSDKRFISAVVQLRSVMLLFTNLQTIESVYVSQTRAIKTKKEKEKKEVKMTKLIFAAAEVKSGSGRKRRTRAGRYASEFCLSIQIAFPRVWMNERVGESSHRLNGSPTGDHKVHAYVSTIVPLSLSFLFACCCAPLSFLPSSINSLQF